MSEAFSNALHNVLQTIDPGKRPSAEDCFPPQCRNVDLRVNAGESPEQWFRRLVDGPLEGDLQSCRVEDNLAIFLQFGSEAERRFRYLRCQALAGIDGSLEDLRQGGAAIKVRYLRLEYDADPLMVGELFSHPVVHIHGQPAEAPRFALESVPTGNTVLLDFLDFLYRNFCHATWTQWASAVWRRSAPTRDSATYFEAIQSYFLEADSPGKRERLPEILALCREWLPRVKRAMRAEKEEMPMNLTVDPDHRDLFTYHL